MDRLTGMHVFTRVVETGSFSRAATDLSLTQPTVTKHVAAIERTLNVQLLNRNTRGISVTEVGALYYERCKTVLHEVALADELVGGKQRQLQGLVRWISASAPKKLPGSQPCQPFNACYIPSPYTCHSLCAV